MRQWSLGHGPRDCCGDIPRPMGWRSASCSPLSLCRSIEFPLTTLQHIQCNMPPETQKEPSTFGDSSRRLFSLYSEIATEEDDKKIDRWQKDADGILVFVSHYLEILAAICIDWNTIDRFILCCCRWDAGHVHRRPKTRPSGDLRILSREYVSPLFPHERFPYPFLSRPILSSEIRRLCEFSLVYEPSYQSYLRSLGNVVTTMDTSLHREYSAKAVSSTRASAKTCILCYRHGRGAHSSSVGC